ncbi:MAG: hypothetical protein AB1Z98_10560, partial [Nannocystaceae bacterium]
MRSFDSSRHSVVAPSRIACLLARGTALGVLSLAAALSVGCAIGDEVEPGDQAWDGEPFDGELEGGDEEEPADDPISQVSCYPQMSVFPVAAAHNIGYDHASCGTGTCQVSCPDAHANSD